MTKAASKGTFGGLCSTITALNDSIETRCSNYNKDKNMVIARFKVKCLIVLMNWIRFRYFYRYWNVIKFDVGYLRLRSIESKCKLLETGDDNDENTGDPNHENMLEGSSNIDQDGNHKYHW